MKALSNCAPFIFSNLLLADCSSGFSWSSSCTPFCCAICCSCWLFWVWSSTNFCPKSFTFGLAALLCANWPISISALSASATFCSSCFSLSLNLAELLLGLAAELSGVAVVLSAEGLLPLDEFAFPAWFLLQPIASASASVNRNTRLVRIRSPHSALAEDLSQSVCDGWHRMGDV